MEDAFRHAIRLVGAFIFASAGPVAISVLSRLVPMPFSAWEMAAAEKRIGLIDTLAAPMPNHRHPAQITHTRADILRARVFAIACGYPDADDLDDLAAQPTMSRWENAPDKRTLIRLSHATVDLWCSSHRRAPAAITLDIDDTADTVHGRQQTRTSCQAAMPLRRVPPRRLGRSSCPFSQRV